MKRFFCLMTAGYCLVAAQTNITTPTVSGVWTLAGSPYLIQNEISIQNNDILIIQPGVVVQFQPATRMEVYGQLIAQGTGNNVITFEAIDTTGWSNEMTGTGGWNGIHIHPYGGIGIDNTIFDYCLLKDGKYGYATVQNYMYPMSIERGMKVHHSVFRHNQTSSGPVGSGATIWSQLYINTDTLDIDNCELTDNISFPSLISVTNPYGFCNITNSHIHHNEEGSGITGLLANMLVENNEIDHNNTVYDQAPINMSAQEVVIRGNEIHHNTSPDHGGMNCNYGHITIENNFIHNNNQTEASCGLSEGGGGMNITCFGPDINDGFFIVRNNIIANNSSAYGGGGINVYNAIACITNNHIINNTAPTYGKAVFIAHPDSRVYMRNNLFYNQISPGNIDSENQVFIYSGSGIWFDYNFMTGNYSQMVRTLFSYTLYGDTIHNVIGNNPGMIAPTTDNSYLTDAGMADFNITAGSTCINSGDTVGAYISTIDYSGNNRLIGTIDIGAYEYQGDVQSGLEDLYKSVPTPLFVYPNPVDASAIFRIVSPESLGQLTIYDVNGKVIFDQTTSSSITTVQLHEKGIFFIEFKGSVKSTGKVIIR
jgi:hypothetical protein